jgi:hypothetical protein
MNLNMARQPGSQRRPERGLELAYRHCASLDPDSPRARERLEHVLGPRDARLLVGALAARPGARPGSGLGLVA